MFIPIFVYILLLLKYSWLFFKIARVRGKFLRRAGTNFSFYDFYAIFLYFCKSSL